MKFVAQSSPTSSSICFGVCVSFSLSFERSKLYITNGICYHNCHKNVTKLKQFKYAKLNSKINYVECNPNDLVVSFFFLSISYQFILKMSCEHLNGEIIGVFFFFFAYDLLFYVSNLYFFSYNRKFIHIDFLSLNIQNFKYITIEG